MSRHTLTPPLRRALAIDAIASAAFGVDLCLFATPLSAWMQIAESGLFWVGAFCLLYAAVLARLLSHATLPRLALWSVVIGNFAWAAGSAALAFSGWIDPNGLGTAFILVQGAIVFGFAELQWVALRRAPRVDGLQQVPA